MDPKTWLTVAEIIGSIVGTVGLLGAATAGFFAYSKAKGNEQALDILTKANAGLMAVNNDLRERQEQKDVAFRDMLHTQELDCARQIAELKGQISVLTGGLAKDIVDAVMAALDLNTTKTVTTESHTTKAT